MQKTSRSGLVDLRAFLIENDSWRLAGNITDQTFWKATGFEFFDKIINNKMVNINILKIMMEKNICHCILMAKERRGEKYKEVQKKTIIKQKYNDADYDSSDI